MPLSQRFRFEHALESSHRPGQNAHDLPSSLAKDFRSQPLDFDRTSEPAVARVTTEDGPPLLLQLRLSRRAVRIR